MPRPLVRLNAKDIQRSRGNWWNFHYEKRQKFLSLPVNEQHTYQNAAMLISPPEITIYGGLPESRPSRDEMRVLMSVQGMKDVDLANPWYTSDEGWQQFNELWQQLPEPVDDLSTKGCVQVGAVVHSFHRRAEVEPGSRH